MRKFVSVLCLVGLLSLPVTAGEIPIGPTPPPACTENCTTSATASPIPVAAIQLLVTLITLR